MYNFCLQTFFIDHNSRTTSFIDPRLPLEPPSSVVTSGVLSNRDTSGGTGDESRTGQESHRVVNSSLVPTGKPVMLTWHSVIFGLLLVAVLRSDATSKTWINNETVHYLLNPSGVILVSSVIETLGDLYECLREFVLCMVWLKVRENKNWCCWKSLKLIKCSSKYSLHSVSEIHLFIKKVDEKQKI